MYPTQHSTRTHPDESDARRSASAAGASDGQSTGASDGEGRADPSLIVRDARSAGLIVGDGSLAFAVTNRGPEPVRLSALGIDCADASVSAIGDNRTDRSGYEVWVDTRRPTRANVGPSALPTTIPLDDPAAVEPGETATVRVYGFRYANGDEADIRDCGATVTLHTEREDRRFETTAQLTV